MSEPAHFPSSFIFHAAGPTLLLLSWPILWWDRRRNSLAGAAGATDAASVSGSSVLWRLLVLVVRVIFITGAVLTGFVVMMYLVMGRMS